MGLPTDDPPTAATQARFRVAGLLCVLSFILYLDRICISQAVRKIEDDLDISHTAMGVVLGAFTLAYGLFQIPVGNWGDRYGSRGVLAGIALWWSVFTALTGAVTGFLVLLVVRFLFGAGEAVVLPNTARVVARWFPAGARGPTQGLILTAALIGGAASPVLAGYLIEWLGWRWSFVVLGLPGILWALVFFWWYRDDPAEHPGVNEAERSYIASGSPRLTQAEPHPPVPWRLVLTSANLWLMGSVISCGSFTTYMLFFWYPTYLQAGRGVDSIQSGWLVGMVLAAGGVGSTFGGYLSDWLVRRTGDRRGTRRAIGCCSLSSAALLMVASIYCPEPWLAAVCAAGVCLAIHLQLIAWWGVVTEVSGKHQGALFGLMNSMGLPGAVGAPLFLGWFVDSLRDLGYTGQAQWNPAFYVYAGVLVIGAVSWLFIDPTRSMVEPLKTSEETVP